MILIIVSPVGSFIAVVAVVLLLLAFVVLGIGAVIQPQRYMNAYLKRGGKLQRDWNELSIQIFGLVFTCLSGWMLYEFMSRFGRR